MSRSSFRSEPKASARLSEAQLAELASLLGALKAAARLHQGPANQHLRTAARLVGFALCEAASAAGAPLNVKTWRELGL